MPSVPDKIIQLRQLLADRFGQEKPAVVEESYPTGLPVLDEIGISRGTVTEIVSACASPGGGLLLAALLHAVLQRGDRAILIDGKDGFSPSALRQEELSRMVWVRCRQAAEAIKAADLAVRDGNVPLVVLLLLLNPAGELRRIPATAWHRLQMLAEKSAATLLVFTPQTQVGCARLRLSVRGTVPLARFHFRRDELMPRLDLRLERRRMERNGDEDLRRTFCA